MDWHEYIYLARGLKPKVVDTDYDRAKARSTVSRAYYGAFHTAWKHVRTKGYEGDIADHKNHGLLWACLMMHSRSEDEQTAGQLGGSLMADRKLADYEDNAGRLDKLSEAALRRAFQICKLLNLPLTR